MTLLGHDGAVTAFLAAAHSDRLHHAWLLTGPQGIGKALFADQAAARLLAEGAGLDPDYSGLKVPEDSQTARLIEAGSHPDHARLQRLARDTGELARSISVAQVRDLQRLFATAPSYSNRRVIIIDAADDLERSAANALLKNLEEPPAGTTFFLVSHAPGRLLPTIRSRCRVLRFARLSDDVMTTVLRRQLPDADDHEIKALVEVGEGSPGRAIGFSGLDIGAMDAAIDRLIGTGDATNADRSALAKSFSTKASQARYEAFLERVPERITSHAKTLQGPPLEHAILQWEEARKIARNAISRSLDREATAFVLGSLLAGLAP